MAITLTQTTAIPSDHYDGGGNLTAGSKSQTEGVSHLAVVQENLRADIAALNAELSTIPRKEDAKMASVAPINLAVAPANVDAIAGVAGDRVLIKDQGAPADNGMYLYPALGAGNPFTRSLDMDTAAELEPGVVIGVKSGTINADTQWQLTSDTTPIVVGTTALTFGVYAGPYETAGNITSIDAGDAAAAGIRHTNTRGDHQHAVNTAAPGATGVATASAVGVATTLARSDHAHQSNTAPTDTTKAAAVIGTSGEPARADHKHDISTAVPGSVADTAAATEGAATSLMRSDAKLQVSSAAPGATGVATASAVGVAGSLARSDHAHQSNTAPADTTKAAAAIGTSGEPARADHKHDISSAAPGATGVATASADGVATSMARSDHAHQSNTAPTDTTKAAAAIGTSGEPARADHKHDISSAAPSATFLPASVNADGVATSMARSDHAHAFDYAATTAGGIPNANKFLALDAAGALDGRDVIADGIKIDALLEKPSVRVATVAALPANTPAGAKVGATITMNVPNIVTVDGQNLVLNDEVLIKDEAALSNGIYVMTTEGTGGVQGVFTRRIDADENESVPLNFFVQAREGTANADTWFQLTNDIALDVDVAQIPVFAACSGPNYPDQSVDIASSPLFLDTGNANSAAAVGDAGTPNIQIFIQELHRIPFVAATPDANDDIIIYAASSPAMTIVDAWIIMDTLEGGALTLTLHDTANGGGVAISSALDCNATDVERTTVLNGNVLSAGSSLYGNFSANPGTLVGTLFISTYRNA